MFIKREIIMATTQTKPDLEHNFENAHVQKHADKYALLGIKIASELCTQ